MPSLKKESVKIGTVKICLVKTRDTLRLLTHVIR